MFTVHSLRHTHIMHHVIDHGLPLPIVQKQVGHRSLKTTSVYLRPSTEKIAEEYEKVKNAHAWLQIKADAVGTWVKRETVFEPDNERHEIYSERIGKYRDLFPLMKEYLAGLEGGE